MKRAYLLVLAGGLLAAVAFFLPFFLTNRAAGVFSPGTSLLDKFRSSGVGNTGHIEFQVIEVAAIDLLEPFGAVLSIVGGLLAFKWARAGSVWALSGAVLSLAYLLWYFTFLYEFFSHPLHFLGTPAPQPEGSFGDFVQFFGIGCWLAFIGLALGFVGALLGWWASSEPGKATPMGKRALYTRAELLVLAGFVIVLVGCFIPSFLFTSQGESMVSSIFQPDFYLVLWPIPLALLLLLIGGVFGLRGSKGAHLTGLVGALTGLAFVLPVFPILGPTGPAIHQEIAYWVLSSGYVLALIGAVLGLVQRPAAPARVQAALAPMPF